MEISGKDIPRFHNRLSVKTDRDSAFWINRALHELDEFSLENLKVDCRDGMDLVAGFDTRHDPMRDMELLSRMFADREITFKFNWWEDTGRRSAGRAKLTSGKAIYDVKLSSEDGPDKIREFVRSRSGVEPDWTKFTHWPTDSSLEKRSPEPPDEIRLRYAIRWGESRFCKLRDRLCRSYGWENFTLVTTWSGRRLMEFKFEPKTELRRILDKHGDMIRRFPKGEKIRFEWGAGRLSDLVTFWEYENGETKNKGCSWWFCPNWSIEESQLEGDS